MTIPSFELSTLLAQHQTDPRDLRACTCGKYRGDGLWHHQTAMAIGAGLAYVEVQRPAKSAT